MSSRLLMQVFVSKMFLVALRSCVKWMHVHVAKFRSLFVQGFNYLSFSYFEQEIPQIYRLWKSPEKQNYSN